VISSMRPSDVAAASLDGFGKQGCAVGVQGGEWVVSVSSLVATQFRDSTASRQTVDTNTLTHARAVTPVQQT
jgi:hypothetical protein